MSELCGKMNTYMARIIVCYKLLSVITLIHLRNEFNF